MDLAELTGNKKAAAEPGRRRLCWDNPAASLENKTQYLATLAPNADMVRSDDYKVRIFGNMAIMTHRHGRGHEKY